MRKVADWVKKKKKRKKKEKDLLNCKYKVLFVCLFIVFAHELVWNVLVNQKGFRYVTCAIL